MTNQLEPQGKLALRTFAMPSDTNANGDIFGGWLVSHMDMGVGIEAKHFARSRVVTVAIDSLTFIKPVAIGDTVSCYTELLKIGHTSMRFKVEVWTSSFKEENQKKVAEGIFTYVAINDAGIPHPVQR